MHTPGFAALLQNEMANTTFVCEAHERIGIDPPVGMRRDCAELWPKPRCPITSGEQVSRWNEDRLGWSGGVLGWYAQMVWDGLGLD